MSSFLISLTAFFLIALASHRIGRTFSQLGLPYITGYLAVGMIAGPFILNLLPATKTVQLHFIEQVSLGIIALIAGSELYLKEIRSLFKTIITIVGCLLLLTLPIIGTGVFFLMRLTPFASDFNIVELIVVSILGGTILLALSPPSTIAVIKEVRAKGNFTRTLLGVTVVMDVVIIIAFAVAASISHGLLGGAGLNLLFIVHLVVDLAVAASLGYLFGKLVEISIGNAGSHLIKSGLLAILGYGIFWVPTQLASFSHTLPIEIKAEPLLIGMIAGFYITNYTPHRNLFEALLHKISPIVYVAFFTLTGATTKLDLLAKTWPIALGLFTVRFVAINLGATAGSRLAQESERFGRFAGLALITQAGIALGLGRTVAVEFPILGDSFATIIISVVVINEIAGPFFLKWALKGAGDIPQVEPSSDDAVRDVLILGVEAQSILLARQLQQVNWRVIMIDTDASHVARIASEKIPAHHINSIGGKTLAGLLTTGTDAVVTMLGDDRQNLAACELARQFGVKRLVVRPNDLSNADNFAELNAIIIDPASAMVNLLEQTVRAPQSTAMFLHLEEGREMIQITINNPDVDGMLVRDLRLPIDVLFIDVTRDDTVILPNGYTRLRLLDEVTLMGRKESLEEATLRLGY